MHGKLFQLPIHKVCKLLEDMEYLTSCSSRPVPPPKDIEDSLQQANGAGQPWTSSKTINDFNLFVYVIICHHSRDFAMCVTYLSCTTTLYSTITILVRVKSWLPPIRYTTVNCITLCALVASGTVLRPVLVGTSCPSGAHYHCWSPFAV